MSTYLWVQLTDEARVVPVEGRPRERFTTTPRRVEETRFVRRRIADGDLVEVDEPRKKARAKAKAEEKP